jgi:putative membrane protein
LRPGVLVGFALGSLGLTGLLAYYGFASISLAVLSAWWGIAGVVLVHTVQLSFTGAAWRALLPPGRRPSLPQFVRFRWIREAVNNLLPVAQIGGEVVGARLMMREGVALAPAAASAIVDLTVEMVTQIVFTLAGLALLITGPHPDDIAGWVMVGLPMTLLAAALFVAAQRFGLLRLVEGGLVRLARRWPGLPVGGVRGLHDAVLAIHRNRRALAAAATCHGTSWALGTLEVAVALAALGHGVSLREAFIIESLGAALRSAGFAVPGALGVQEAAFIFVAAPFGVPAETAIALSMIKRVRELLFSLPGLAAWQWSEGRRLAGHTPARLLAHTELSATVARTDRSPGALS